MNLKELQVSARPFLVPIAAAGLLAGLGGQAAGMPGWADGFWRSATLPVLAALLAEIVTSLRRGDFGLDLVAALSMSAALVVGETLAAAVVALMYAGGQHLELFAERRAKREMTALLARVPRAAMRYRDGVLEEVALDAIEPGDRLMIPRGDVLPVDGTVLGNATLDESALTGEALPVRHPPGAAVMSGPVNVGDAFDLSATRRAAESTFAGIVRLVEEAGRSKAPMVRLADRFALWFLGLTLVIASAAWGLTGDPVRMVAVLVVATPCPLILAVPVAFVAGLSRAARHGILIKGARPLEAMARVAVLILDKTGTLTDGRPRLVATRPHDSFDAETVLRLAAGLDQASRHTVAQTIVAAARASGLTLAVPEEVTEVAGEGIEGRIEGRAVVVGGTAFVAARLGVGRMERAEEVGTISVAVGVDGMPAGELILSDALRTGTGELLTKLRERGVERLVLATGDRLDVATAVSAALPFDSVHAELTPEAKVQLVVAEREGGPVMMIGDGVNDAPALAAADVGVAMGARGAAATAEAADVVLLVDRLDRILSGLDIARRSRHIALESVIVGIGLSVAGMLAAAFGLITPVEGALLQEAIDVAVILNALRALRGGLGVSGGDMRPKAALPDGI